MVGNNCITSYEENHETNIWILNLWKFLFHLPRTDHFWLLVDRHRTYVFSWIIYNFLLGVSIDKWAFAWPGPSPFSYRHRPVHVTRSSEDTQVTIFRCPISFATIQHQHDHIHSYMLKITLSSNQKLHLTILLHT